MKTKRLGKYYEGSEIAYNECQYNLCCKENGMREEKNVYIHS